MDTLFEFLSWSWSVISSVLWVTAYLVPTWITAYALKMTAPQQCPKGLEYRYCFDNHSPLHVLRNKTWVAVAMGLFWPVLWVGGMGYMFTKSIDAAAAITPTPKPKPVNTDRMLEQADSEFEEMKEETSKHVDRIIEGKITFD